MLDDIAVQGAAAELLEPVYAGGEVSELRDRPAPSALRPVRISGLSTAATPRGRPVFN